MMPTLCKECDHVETASRKLAPYKWLCLRFPRLGEVGFVDPDYWSIKEPYNRCANINLGACPCFTPMRKPDGLDESQR